MAQKNSGVKLRRTSKHKNMYAAQFHRTERNKAKAVERIARRKRDNPNHNDATPKSEVSNG